MRVRRFARHFRDEVYRAEFVAICCRPHELHVGVDVTLKAHGGSKTHRRLVLEALKASNSTEQDMEDCAGICWRLHPPKLVPWFVIWIRPGATVDTVVHECWHAVAALLRDRGVPVHKQAAEEAVAYLLARVFRGALGIER